MTQTYIKLQRIPLHGTPDVASLELNDKTPDRLFVIGGLSHCVAIKFDKDARAQLRRWLDEQDAADDDGTPPPLRGDVERLVTRIDDASLRELADCVRLLMEIEEDMARRSSVRGIARHLAVAFRRFVKS